LKDAAKNQSAKAVAHPKAEKGAPAKVEVKEEKKEEEADVDMGGLFGGDDGY